MDSRHNPVVVEGPAGPNISLNGRLLYPRSLSVEKRVTEATEAAQTLFILPSPLLFLGVDDLLSRISGDSFVLAVESSPELYSITRPWFNRISDSRIRYELVEKINDFYQILDSLDEKRCRRVKTIRLNRGYMLDRAFYDILSSSAETHINTFWKNRMTTIHMGRLWLKNIFTNLPSLSAGCDIAELSTDKPVFVAGAGESLEGSFELISRHRKSLFLLAVDTSASSLISRGIIPDLIVAVESQHANLYDFYDMQTLEIPAAFDLTSSPEIIRKHMGRKYWFVSGFHQAGVFSRLSDSGLLPSVVPPLGSVGITAVYIALQLTSSNVFFSGLDFSFTPEKYHSSGAPSHLLSLSAENRTGRAGFFDSAYSNRRFSRTGKNGRRVFTDLVMLSYADSLLELHTRFQRLYDAGRIGIETGIPVISGEQDFISKLDETKPEGPSTAFTSGSLRTSDATERDILYFLNGESRMLRDMTESTVAYINSGSVSSNSAELPEELEGLANEADYTWLFFPDIIRPVSELSFLKRLLYSSQWFQNIISRSISVFGLQN